MKLNKIRCSICHKWFRPLTQRQKTCSESCRKQSHRIYDQQRYQGRIKSKKGKSTPTIRVPVLTHKSQLKQAFKSAKEALASLTPSEIAHVNAIMNLPYEQRWLGGAKDWTEAQHVLARQIELKRIAFRAKELSEEDSIRELIYKSAQTDSKDYSADDFSDDQLTNDE